MGTQVVQEMILGDCALKRPVTGRIARRKRSADNGDRCAYALQYREMCGGVDARCEAGDDGKLLPDDFPRQPLGPQDALPCRPPWLWPGSGKCRRRAEVSFLGSMPGFSSTMPLSTGKVEIMGVAAAVQPRERSAAAQARPTEVARGGACRDEFTYTVGHH